MKKFFALFSMLLTTLLIVNAKAMMAPEEQEENQSTIEIALLSGEEEINLTNGNVSVDFANAVVAKFDAIVPQEASYTLQTMNLVEGEESSSWVAGETVAQGALALNGTGFAEFDETIYFNQGERYVLTVEAKVEGEVIATQKAEFNGSYAASMVVTTSLMLGEDEVAINDHAAVSVENADAIKVQVENEPSVIGFSYNINAMKAVEGEEGTTWVADESYDLAVGEGNFNGGVGYAQFEDGTINFEEGNKYQVKVTVYGGDPSQDPAELGVYTYEINGAYAASMVVTTSLMLGEDEVAINDHSAVSVENADAIKVQVENEPSVIGFSYNINAMKAVEGEEGTTWVADESYDLAVGEGNFNGGTGYAQFEAGTINFEEGNKYQVKVTVYGGNPAEPAELGVYTYEINGAYAASMVVTTSLMLGEDEVAINDHSAVSVENADAIKVQVENEPSVIGFSYNINAMKAVEGEEGTTWVADESYDLAVGEGNFNGGTGYAQFEDGAINFEEGNKYQVKVTVYGGDPAEPAELGVYTYEINGAYAASMVVTTSLMLGEDEVAINDHSAVSVENADAIKVQVENEPSVIGFTYAINAMNLNEDEEGQYWTVGAELAVGEGNFNGGTGYAQFEAGTINFEEGNKYQVSVTVMGGNPAEPAELASYTYEINGAYAPALTVSTSLMYGESEVAINEHSAVSVDMADAIKVQVENEPSAIGFSYNIYTMKAIEDEEGTTWVADYSNDLAVGEGNFNGGMGYAQFENGAINFAVGSKYQVSVTVYGGNPAEPAELGVYTYEINGANIPQLGNVSWGLELNEEGLALLEEDMINLGVPVTFPNVILPEELDPLSLTVTVSASLYGIPTNEDIMPISGEGEVGDESTVDGPVVIAEAQLHNGYIDATGLHVNLFPEVLELGNHYGIIINAVTVEDGEEVVLELDGDINSPEIVVVPAKVVPTLGQSVWGLEINEEGVAALEEDMINIGVPVSFPDVVLPENVDPLSLTVTVSASLYGIPTNEDIMPISGEGEVGDESTVDGPVVIAEAQLHNGYIDATGLHVNLFPEVLELGNHYGIIINAVTVMDGEEVVLELEGDIQSPEIVVVPAKVVPTLGEVAWGLEINEEGVAALEEDMINIGVPVSFPDVVLPENVDPLSLNVTVSASLYGIPTNEDIMPISGEGEVGDESTVDGPVVIAEAQLHNGYIDATGLHVNLFPEVLELGNHYGIIINAVTVEDGEEVILELEGDINSPEIVVVPATVAPSFGGVAFNIEEGEEITVDDVHNLAIKMYFPEGTGFEGYVFRGDAMLVKQNAEGEWDMVDFAELYSEYAEDMMDAEFAPALFAEALQNAEVGETYRVLAIDYALLDAEEEPVVFESYENPATAPYVTFTVVDNTSTGINSVNASSANVMFNIAGQRVNNAKGIVIMNGKKMVRK